MGGGYVLHFSNPKFRDLVITTVEIDIEEEKYSVNGTSKANRLRKFWDLESDIVVGKLLYELILIAKDTPLSYADQKLPNDELVDDCFRIINNLKENSVIENIEAIQATNNDKDFVNLAKIIREAIGRNEPENALDRLHTYIVMLVRDLCNTHNIEYSKDETLNAVFGNYVKHLQKNNLVEAEMSVTIMKTSISIIESFNGVRNNRTYTHANPVLNYDESIFIFNNLVNLVKFITKIEGKISVIVKNENTSWDELPF